MLLDWYELQLEHNRLVGEIMQAFKKEEIVTRFIYLEVGELKSRIKISKEIPNDQKKRYGQSFTVLKRLSTKESVHDLVQFMIERIIRKVNEKTN